jgi:hypothetical protein
VTCHICHDLSHQFSDGILSCSLIALAVTSSLFFLMVLLLACISALIIAYASAHVPSSFFQDNLFGSSMFCFKFNALFWGWHL